MGEEEVVEVAEVEAAPVAGQVVAVEVEVVAGLVAVVAGLLVGQVAVGDHHQAQFPGALAIPSSNMSPAEKDS